MDICIASQADLVHLARLLWLHAAPDEQAKQSVESFAVDLKAWWTDHNDSHLAFIARLAGSEVVGMAWLAAASEHASRLGATRVTVHSGRKAVPVYERLGFASSPRLLQKNGR